MNINQSDRRTRIIVFHARQLTPGRTRRECYSLSVLSNDGVELCRDVGDDSGLVATLTARADSLKSLINVFLAMDAEYLFVQGEDYALALSYIFEPLSDNEKGTRLQLQQLVGQCDRLELRTDVSTTFGMPADTLWLDVQNTQVLRARTLASCAPVPEATVAAAPLRRA